MSSSSGTGESEASTSTKLPMGQNVRAEVKEVSYMITRFVESSKIVIKTFGNYIIVI